MDSASSRSDLVYRWDHPATGTKPHKIARRQKRIHIIRCAGVYSEGGGCCKILGSYRKCPGGTQSGPRGYTAPAHLRCNELWGRKQMREKQYRQGDDFHVSATHSIRRDLIVDAIRGYHNSAPFVRQGGERKGQTCAKA